MKRSVFSLAILLLCSSSHALEKSGTGFAISPDLVLTAFHVVENGESISVSFGDASFPATTTSFNKDLDWALLKISGMAPAVVRLGSSDSVKLGDGVYTLGFPATDLLGDGIKYSKGEIGALSGLAGSKDHFQISVPIQPGNSGGPLFTESGDVVGIVVSTLDPGAFFSMTDGALPQGVNYALKIGSVPNLPSSQIPSSKSIDVESNQRAIGAIRVQINRNRIDLQGKRPTPDKQTPSPVLPANEYDRKLQEISNRLNAILARLTEFSPDTFCQTNGVTCPILTDEDTDVAEAFLDQTKLELEYAIETAKKEILTIPDRDIKSYEYGKYPFSKKEEQLFQDLPIEKEWIAARNRLAEHYNAIAENNGVITPTSFWGLSFTKESFSNSFSNWVDMPGGQNASIGTYPLPKPFLGACAIRGIRSKMQQTPVALWCRIPTGVSNLDPFTVYMQKQNGSYVDPCSFPEEVAHGVVDLSGKRKDWKELPEYQEHLLKQVLKIFERKYSFRFSLSKESNNIATGSGWTSIIPVNGWIKDYYQTYRGDSCLYYFHCPSLDIRVRSFYSGKSSEKGTPVGTIIFIAVPNWQTILADEYHSAKMSETVEVDDSTLESL